MPEFVLLKIPMAGMVECWYVFGVNKDVTGVGSAVRQAGRRLRIHIEMQFIAAYRGTFIITRH